MEYNYGSLSSNRLSRAMEDAAALYNRSLQRCRPWMPDFEATRATRRKFVSTYMPGGTNMNWKFYQDKMNESHGIYGRNVVCRETSPPDLSIDRTFTGLQRVESPVRISGYFTIASIVELVWYAMYARHWCIIVYFEDDENVHMAVLEAMLFGMFQRVNLFDDHERARVTWNREVRINVTMYPSAFNTSRDAGMADRELFMKLATLKPIPHVQCFGVVRAHEDALQTKKRERSEPRKDGLQQNQHDSKFHGGVSPVYPLSDESDEEY